MQFTIYDLINIVLNCLNTYVICRMMRIFNKSYSYNKRVEFISYLIFTLVNFIMLGLTEQSYILMTSVVLTLFLVSYNYESKLRTKILSVIYTIMLIYLSEIVSLLFMQHTLGTVAVSNAATIRYYIYCRVIDFTTLMFLRRLEEENLKSTRPFISWYSHIMIGIMAIVVSILMLRDIDEPTEAFFNIFLTVYILAAFAFLYYTDRFIKRKSENNLQQQIDNYHTQYNLLMSTTKLLMEMDNSIKEHLRVIRKFADDSEKQEIIAYIDDIIAQDKSKTIIRTGNLTIDSVLNMKFDEARQGGCEIEYEILIPANINIADADITTILTGLLNGAIKAVSVRANRKLSFFMRYEKGLLMINLIYANRRTNRETKAETNVYPDAKIMELVEAAVHNYDGFIRSEISEDAVDITAGLFVSLGDKVVF